MHRNLQVKVNSEVQYIQLLVSAIYGYHQVDNKNRKEVFTATWVRDRSTSREYCCIRIQQYR